MPVVACGRSSTISSCQLHVVQQSATCVCCCWPESMERPAVRSSATYDTFKKDLKSLFWTVLFLPIVTIVYFDYVQRPCSSLYHLSYITLQLHRSVKVFLFFMIVVLRHFFALCPGLRISGLTATATYEYEYCDVRLFAELFTEWRTINNPKFQSIRRTSLISNM